jgi:hypothetical protein
MEPLISIRLCDPHRQYQPGDRMLCSYQVDAIAADAIHSVETSILWITSGKGEEDMGIHEFHRRLKDDDNLDLRSLHQFETFLPESPLSFGGTIVKLHWLARVRLLLQEGTSHTQDLSFQLGSLPVFTEGAP